MGEINATVDKANPNGYPSSWVSDAQKQEPVEADAPIEESSTAQEIPLAVCTNQADCDCDLHQRIREMEYLWGLMLEQLYQITMDVHRPKAYWDKTMIGVWEAHKEKKRAGKSVP